MTSKNLYKELDMLTQIALSQLCETVARDGFIEINPPVLLPGGYGAVRIALRPGAGVCFGLVADVVDVDGEPTLPELVEDWSPRRIFNLVEALEALDYDFTDGHDEILDQG